MQIEITDALMDAQFTDTQTLPMMVGCSCDKCRNDIYSGEDYYRVSDINICEECLPKFKAVATAPCSCDKCEGEIYGGEDYYNDYYKIGDANICEECISDFLEEAPFPEREDCFYDDFSDAM